MLRQALKPGDTIGITATSGPTITENVRLAKEQLEGLGFKTKLAPSCCFLWLFSG